MSGGILKKQTWARKIMSEKYCEQCCNYDKESCPHVKTPKQDLVLCDRFRFDFEFDKTIEKSLLRTRKKGN